MSDLRLQHPSLVLPTFEQDGLAIAHSGREFGNMDPRFGTIESVLSNRVSLYENLELQVGNVAVMRVANDAETFVDLGSERVFDEDIFTDAFITPEPGVGLAMNLADCNAIALSDGTVLGMIHAGWRGAVHDLPSRVIDRMVRRYDFDPENATAYFAPAIHQASYAMPDLHPDQRTEPWEPFIVTRDNMFHVDLPGFLTRLLQVEWSMPAKNIVHSGIDVGVDDTHFSFTRFKEDPVRSPNGRNGFVAVRG